MSLTLSWDLLIIVFFAVIVAYSFIVGKDESVKIIIATYIAIVAVQGTGNILTALFGETSTLAGQSQSLLASLGFTLDVNMISIMKIVLFVAFIVFLSIRGGFTMTYDKVLSGIWDILLTGAFGFGTSGLMVSTLLTYVADRPLLDASLASAPALAPLLGDGRLVRIMVEYQDVWFALPAFMLLAVGIFQSLSERE